MESGGYWSGYRRTAYGRHFTTIRISKWLFDGMRQKQITRTIQNEEEARKLRGCCLALNHGYITPPHPDDCLHPLSKQHIHLQSHYTLYQTNHHQLNPKWHLQLSQKPQRSPPSPATKATTKYTGTSATPNKPPHTTSPAWASNASPTAASKPATEPSARMSSATAPSPSS